MFSIGDFAEHHFVIDARAMKAFEDISGDRHPVHVDDDFARARGFREAIMYGGLIVCQLPHVMANILPGEHGTLVQLRIDYRQPLYINEHAKLRLEPIHVSTLPGIIEGKFAVTAAERTIATGQVQSYVHSIKTSADC